MWYSWEQRWPYSPASHSLHSFLVWLMLAPTHRAVKVDLEGKIYGFATWGRKVILLSPLIPSPSCWRSACNHLLIPSFYFLLRISCNSHFLIPIVLLLLESCQNHQTFLWQSVYPFHVALTYYSLQCNISNFSYFYLLTYTCGSTFGGRRCLLETNLLTTGLLKVFFYSHTLSQYSTSQ